MSLVQQLVDRICDRGLSQSSQSGRGFGRVFLVDPSDDLGNDVDMCTIGARTVNVVVDRYYTRLLEPGDH